MILIKPALTFSTAHKAPHYIRLRELLKFPNSNLFFNYTCNKKEGFSGKSHHHSRYQCTTYGDVRTRPTILESIAQFHQAGCKHQQHQRSTGILLTPTSWGLAEVEQSGIYVDRGTCQFDRCYPSKSTHGCETTVDPPTYKHTNSFSATSQRFVVKSCRQINTTKNRLTITFVDYLN